MSQTQEPQQLDRKDMKIIALKERLAEITVQYEDKDADRRIAITEAGQRIEELEAQVGDLLGQLTSKTEGAPDEEEAPIESPVPD